MVDNDNFLQNFLMFCFWLLAIGVVFRLGYSVEQLSEGRLMLMVALI